MASLLHVSQGMCVTVATRRYLKCNIRDLLWKYSAVKPTRDYEQQQ